MIINSPEKYFNKTNFKWSITEYILKRFEKLMDNEKFINLNEVIKTPINSTLINKDLGNRLIQSFLFPSIHKPWLIRRKTSAKHIQKSYISFFGIFYQK